jgi:hypothetical protein
VSVQAFVAALAVEASTYAFSSMGLFEPITRSSMLLGYARASVRPEHSTVVYDDHARQADRRVAML